MPKIPIPELQDYLDEEQGEMVSRRYSRKEKKEKKESLSFPRFPDEE